MKKKSIALFVISALAFAANASAFNLITNGDFETGDLTGWSTNNNNASANGNVQVIQAGPFANAQGMDNYYALLGLGTTDGTSRLRQDFDVTGVNEITVSFDWAFDYWDNATNADDTFLSFVRQDGNPAERITMLDLITNGTFTNPSIDLAYGTFTKTYDISNYTTDEARLIFRLTEESTNSIFTGTASVAGIDNVVITGIAPVPEPSTYAMFGTAFALLGFVGYRSRKNKK